MAKKCTKKLGAHAKLLFCQSKPIAFLRFSLPSPWSSSSLLKLAKETSREERAYILPGRIVQLQKTTTLTPTESRDWKFQGGEVCKA